MTYAVHETPTVFVDHEALAGLLSVVAEPGARAVLIGFNEYSKHLLNLAGDNVVAIYDSAPWKVGIRFRDKVVAPADHRFEGVTRIVVCDYQALYEFVGVIDRLYDFTVPLYWPPRLEYKSTEMMDLVQHDVILRDVVAREAAAPVSMMAREKVILLTELMRSALANPGDLIEMGVYQGGSVWYLGQVLKALGETRSVFMMDVFEGHMMHPVATMCRDEIERKLADYPHCVLLEGLVDDPALLARMADRRFCFAHYDLGFHPAALAFVWERLEPGSPFVLDNYGHIAAWPWRFDDFFAERGARVIRLPWSEQGIVFKPAAAPAPLPPAPAAPAPLPPAGGLRGLVDRLTGSRPA